jgi:hypothetical protein
MNDGKEEEKSVWDSVRDFIIKETSLALSLTYVALIAIGMLFSYQYYSIWDIDIFQFAGFEDFLLAPFKDILVFAFVAVSVLMAFLAIRFSKKMDKKYPHLAKRWNFGISSGTTKYRRLKQFNLIFGVLFYLYQTSIVFAWFREWRVNKRPELFRISIEAEDNKLSSYLLLGMTDHYVLVLSEKDKKPHALPLEGGSVRIIHLGTESRP